MSEAIEEVKAKRKKTDWDSSTFEVIKEFEIDNRGMTGEIFTEKNLKSLGYEVERDENPGGDEKEYDILLNGKIKIEVKTATRGANDKTFQHEGLHPDRDFDILILIDVAPNNIYVTCVKKKDLPFDIPNNNFSKRNKKMHKRKSGVYKWDLNIKDIEEREVKTLEDFKRIFEAAL